LTSNSILEAPSLVFNNTTITMPDCSISALCFLEKIREGFHYVCPFRQTYSERISNATMPCTLPKLQILFAIALEKNFAAIFSFPSTRSPPSKRLIQNDLWQLAL
jgi:hypothetical protein